MQPLRAFVNGAGVGCAAMAAAKRPSLKKPRGRFHHGSLREAAIAVATAELEQNGFASLTLERVAAKLGVTRPALYRHFENRKALLQAVAQPIFVRFETALTDAFFSKQDSWAALEAVWLQYLDFAMKNPAWFRLQFTAPAHERPMPDLEAAPARYAPAIQDALRAAFGPKSRELDALYVGAWGMAHGQAMLAVEQILPVPDAYVLHQQTLRVFISSLRAYSREVLAAARSSK